MAEISEIKFPVVTLKERVIDIHRSESSLCLATQTALKSGWFSGMTVVDASGWKYRVRSARYRRDTGRRAFKGWFAPRLIEVDFDLEKRAQVTVEEMRTLIQRAINNDRSFWESGDDLDAFLVQLEDAATLEGIWRALEPFLARAPERTIER